MKPLSTYALKQIEAYDLQRSIYCSRNLTRFYKWLVRDGQDIQIRTVAIKTRKNGSVCIKEVVRSSVDRDEMFVRDVVLTSMSGYTVDWHREKLGRKREWDYKGRWMEHDYMPKDCLFKMAWVVTINVDLLKRVKRFKWCAYYEGCGCILNYLKLYVKHPRIEFLSKQGLGRFAKLPGFVKQLEGDKDLLRFFSKNIEAIKGSSYKSDVVLMAYRLNIPLRDASRRLEQLRSWRGLKLPRSVDGCKAFEYVKRSGVNEWNYCRYLKDCMTIGWDMKDTKVVFPKHFKARAKVALSMFEEIKRREKIELQKKMDTDLATMAQKLSKLEAVTGPFKVIIPKREQDFRNEGKRLNHCIGNGCYVSGHASGEHVIAFIRRARSLRVPFVTLQFSPESGKVNQCYGKNNSKPEKRVLDFIHGAFTKAAKRIVAKAI